MPTKLIVLRGSSGSGKSSVAKVVRATCEGRRVALIEQDYVRRTLLKEKDIPNGVNIKLIKETVLYALRSSYDVLLEGILDAGRYDAMLNEIVRIHPEQNHFFYFDISLEETIRRHQYKPNKDEFGEEELRKWYRHQDFLPDIDERVVPEISSLEETIALIAASLNESVR